MRGMGLLQARGVGEREVAELLLHALLAFLCLFSACVEICDAAAVVDVYRVIQYDLQGMPFGSRRASLSHHASSLLLHHHNADLSRTVAILPISKLNLTALNDFLQSKRLLGGLLLLLPQNFVKKEQHTEGDSEDLDADGITSLEQWLINNNIPFPVYFAFEDEKLKAVLREVEENDATGRHATALTGGYKFVVPVTELKKLGASTITNIQAWLPGLRGEGDSSQLPTIAIVASYDTFGAAPALSVGTDSNGSGVVALLELARLFSRLYSSAKTHGRYNLLFGLTAGSPYNYNGTSKWLRGFDQRIRESIDYALCLNSISSGTNQLWLHVSKPPDNIYIKHIYDTMSKVAEGLGITIEIRHKKINISNSRVAWEHEQFSRHRVTAATVSQLDTAPELLQHTGGIYDQRGNGNDTVLIQNIKVIAESLAKHIYGDKVKNMEIFEDASNFAVSSTYVHLWLDLLSRTPRVAPFLSKNDPIIVALQKELAEHTYEVSLQQEVTDNAFIFYDLPKAQLSIYQVASVTFDLLIMLAVGTYLLLLFIILVVSTKGLDDLAGYFRRPPSRKVKPA